MACANVSSTTMTLNEKSANEWLHDLFQTNPDTAIALYQQIMRRGVRAGRRQRMRRPQREVVREQDGGCGRGGEGADPRYANGGGCQTPGCPYCQRR
jgi:hypothetical protein